MATSGAWWAEVQRWTNETPPAFGHPMLAEFDLEPAYTNVNQGSYGSTPRRVRRATEQLVLATESNPDLWFRAGLSADGANSLYIDQLVATRKALAEYIKAPLEETSIVDNASHGINAVLRSVPDFLAKKGLLYLDLAYGEVRAALSFMGGTYPGADSDPSVGHRHGLHEVNTSSLGTDLGADRLVPLVERALREANGTVGLCSFSHIVSIPALILPVKELAAACRRAGALTLIDGAYAGMLSQEVPTARPVAQGRPRAADSEAGRAHGSSTAQLSLRAPSPNQACAGQPCARRAGARCGLLRGQWPQAPLHLARRVRALGPRRCAALSVPARH